MVISLLCLSLSLWYSMVTSLLCYIYLGGSQWWFLFSVIFIGPTSDHYHALSASQTLSQAPPPAPLLSKLYNGSVQIVTCISCPVFCCWKYSPVGWFLLGKVFSIRLCMFPSCSHCFTGLRTYFVFSVAQLLPMVIVFFGFNGNFNGKMTKINKMTKNHFSGVQNGSKSV